MDVELLVLAEVGLADLLVRLQLARGAFERDVTSLHHVAHRGYVMETGHIALEGPAGELKTNEQVRKTYLGED